MNLRLRSLETLDQARPLAEVLGRALVESYPGGLAEAGSGGEAAERLGQRFLEAHFEDPLTLLLVAETDRPLAVAATGPLADPVTGARSPLMAALWVHPELRRRGIARELVGELKRLVRLRTRAPLLARVPSGDDTLLAMAERWGLVRDVELVSSH